MNWWPFVSNWTFEKVRRENVLSREALKQANGELRKHRLLIADLRMGHEATTAAIERVFVKLPR